MKTFPWSNIARRYYWEIWPLRIEWRYPLVYPMSRSGVMSRQSLWLETCDSQISHFLYAPVRFFAGSAPGVDVSAERNGAQVQCCSPSVYALYPREDQGRIQGGATGANAPVRIGLGLGLRLRFRVRVRVKKNFFGKKNANFWPKTPKTRFSCSELIVMLLYRPDTIFF